MAASLAIDSPRTAEHSRKPSGIEKTKFECCNYEVFPSQPAPLSQGRPRRGAGVWKHIAGAQDFCPQKSWDFDAEHRNGDDPAG